MCGLYLKNSQIGLIIVAIVALIFAVNFIIPTGLEKMQCKEKGGKWAELLGGGCGMSPDACKNAGGKPTGYLQCRSITMTCPFIGIDGCDFE